MTPTIFVAAALSIGYSGLWAHREDFRYTFPLGGYAAASSGPWEVMGTFHHHPEGASTYRWTHTAILAGPRFALAPRGRWTPFVHASAGLSYISTTYGDPYLRQPTFTAGPGVDLALAPGGRLRLGIDYRQVAQGEVPNAGVSMSVGLVFGGGR